MAGDVTDRAIALYDGGWNSGDADLMMREFSIDRAEAEQICREIEAVEESVLAEGEE